MKNLLRRIKRSLIFRLCYRLVCWINYPTSRERMWHMYACGKAQGIKEALKNLPIVQVQPAVPKIEIKPPSLPPGMLLAQWLQTHDLSQRPVIPSQPAYWPEPIESFPAWLNSKPHKVEQDDPLDTTESPAIVALLHQEKNAK